VFRWFASQFTTSDFIHTSNNISKGISIKLFRAARLPRVFLRGEQHADIAEAAELGTEATEASTLMLCTSSRPRFKGLLSACSASGIEMMIEWLSDVSLR
jgi:hypothetical protein